jgi:hypothetical protein
MQMKSWLRLLILAIAALALSSASHAQCTSINPLGALPSDTSNQHQWCTAGANVYQGQVVSLNGSGNIVPIPHGSTGGAYGVAQQNAQSGQTGVKILISGRTSLSTDNACAVGNQIGISTTSDGNGTCATSAASQVLGVAIVASSGASATSVQISPLSSAGSSSGSGGGSSSVFSITTYGAKCDGAHMTADTAAFLAAVAAVPQPAGGVVAFPAGSCLLNNSSAAFTMANLSNVTFQGVGPSSSIAFSTLANHGWVFTGASGLTIKDLSFSFTPTRTTRGGGYSFSIDSSSNILVSNNYFNNGNLSGFRVGNSTIVRIVNNTITNFLANGIFTVNNSDIKFENTTCSNNGDGCEEYSFFDGQTLTSSARISSVGMSSHNDNAGCVINGVTNVSFTNFVIDGAGGFACNILQDPATTTTHYPDMIEIGNGSITNTGYGTNASNTVAAPAIQINITGTPATTQRILLHDIHITHTAQRAIVLTDHNTVNLTTSNIWIDDAGAAQITSSGEAIALEGGNVVKMSNTFVEKANRYSLRNDLATYFESTGFTSKDAQLSASSTAAIRNSSTGTWIMRGIHIIDTNGTTSRGIIQSTAASGIQSVTDVTYSCVVACGAPTFSQALTSPQFLAGADMSLAPSASAFHVPNVAAASTTVPGTIAYDTTNKNVHVGANTADNLAAIIPSATPPVNGDCASWSVVGGVIRIADVGAACGTPGGTGCTAGCNYVLTQGDAPVIQSVNATAMTANNTPQMVQFYNALSRKLGTINLRINTTSAGGHLDVGVYSVSGTTGTLVWHTGSLSTAAGGVIAATPTPVTLSASTSYYVAWCADNTTVILNGVASNASGLGQTAAGTAHTSGTDATDVCTTGVLPGTMTTTNITNSANASIPFIYAIN